MEFGRKCLFYSIAIGFAADRPGLHTYLFLLAFYILY